MLRNLANRKAKQREKLKVFLKFQDWVIVTERETGARLRRKMIYIADALSQTASGLSSGGWGRVAQI